ncbi:MAG: glycosyltransferase family 2 protein [Pseudomonadota bacterium]|nr:glycosyltransferase family 2 protein [Pseudomonadota bacterium]
MSADRRHSLRRQFLIVLPVRNGGEYLKACVASILAQSHEHFRLVILENASTDDTPSWLRQVRDPRITVCESPVPLDIEGNWARILDLDIPEEFLTVIGHDDLLDPGYLSDMSALIDAHPDAGLYQSHFRLIDKHGRRLRSCLPMPARETAGDFLAARLRLRRDSYGTGYMFRARDYLRIGGIPPYKKLMFADDALWLGLMHGSYKATLARDTFSYRLHPGGTSHSPDWRSTFEALACYLDFLKSYSRSDGAVQSGLQHGMADYMIFWFRWVYFSADRGERPEILRAIEALSAKGSEIDTSLRLGPFRERVRAALRNRMPRWRWFFWQLDRYLRLRLRSMNRTPARGP